MENQDRDETPTIPCPPMTEQECWDAEIPKLRARRSGLAPSKLFACEVRSWRAERGECGCTEPYGQPAAYGYGHSEAEAVQAAELISAQFDRDRICDDWGFEPTHCWGADEVHEVKPTRCTACEREHAQLTPWPTIFECSGCNALLCPECLEASTGECGCPLTIDCDCADWQAHNVSDELRPHECGLRG